MISIHEILDQVSQFRNFNYTSIKNIESYVPNMDKLLQEDIDDLKVEFPWMFKLCIVTNDCMLLTHKIHKFNIFCRKLFIDDRYFLQMVPSDETAKFKKEPISYPCITISGSNQIGMILDVLTEQELYYRKL